MKPIFTAAMGAAALALTSGVALADDYPSKTIEVVTHAGAGGGTDVTTRMMMLRARRELKADMVVVNKKGGGGTTAMDYYLTVPADGYTILTFTIGHAAELAKLRIFSDLSVEDAGKLLSMSRATAYRQWTYARAWLKQIMNSTDDSEEK